MKRIIIPVLVVVTLAGCSRQSITHSWDISTTLLDSQEYQLDAELHKLTTSSIGPWVKVQVEVISLPGVVLKADVPIGGTFSEPDIPRSVFSEATLHTEDRTVLFKFIVEDRGATYSTNGVFAIE